jgi:hypothetical protein
LSDRRRANRKKSFGVVAEDARDARAPGYAGPPAANTALELCAFCTEQPSGARGHPGFSQQVHKIPVSCRSYVRLECMFCGTNWARRRIDAMTFEWRRFAG